MRTENCSQYAAFIGLDWGDQMHVIHLITADGQTEKLTLNQTPEAIQEWASKLAQRFGDRQVAACLEQSRGPLVAALLQYKIFVLFPVNPKQLAKFREAMYPSGSKDDPTDAELLAELVQHHAEHLRAWLPDDTLTRQIARCCESRRKLVEERKRLSQRLRQLLKEYYPLALTLFQESDLYAPMVLDFLMRWPTLNKAKRSKPAYLKNFFHAHNCRNNERIEQRINAIRAAQPLTTDDAIVEPGVLMLRALVRQLREINKSIAEFDQAIAKLFANHQDYELFHSLPGAGDVLAPRLLAAMGSQRERYETAADVQAYSGIAPVTKKSGRTRIVQRRYACPKFLRQTFHEFAERSIRYSDWARAYYRMLRARGKKYHAAVRALAFKWIRIIHRLWHDRQPYDEIKYHRSLKARNSPVAAMLAT